jgi:hypothetical protein
MNKRHILLLLGVIFSSVFLFGMGCMNKEQPAYRAIFRKSSYYIADLTAAYRIKNVESIDDYLDRKAEFSRERYSERIVSLLEYNKILIQITVYITTDINGSTASAAGHDVYFIDKDGSRTVLSLGANINRQSELRFAKIINNTLFIGLDEPYRQTNIIMVQLDKKEYNITKYIPNLGIIKNIWIQNDENLLYTTYNDNKQESGNLRIINGNVPELIEQFDYVILEYDSSGKMIGINKNGNLFYRDADKNSYIFNNIEGTVYKAFFLESNKIIICSFVSKYDPVANLLFGGPNMKLTYNSYRYYSIIYNDSAIISKEKINTINHLWNLEQIIYR